MRTLFALVLSVAMAAAGTVALPRQRSIRFETAVTVKDIPAGAQAVDLWIPVPHDDPYQRISNFHVDAPYPFDTATGGEENRILHLRVARPAQPSFAVTVYFDAARQEHLRPVAAGSPIPDPPDLAQYLQPDRLVPLDPTIRRWAREVTDAAGAKTDLAMAGAIYNHIVATVNYDKTGKGWGNGDIYYACDARRGNCTDFHAIFIGYARAMGMPARFAIGFPIPATRGAGKIAGYHCWAEFYAKGLGWIPIDASEAAKDPSRREYFFGTHDENRVELSCGRDVVLSPRQQGPPLNYFVYPYVELDGGVYSAVETSYSYKDLATGLSPS